jgi:hypothetical protein
MKINNKSTFENFLSCSEKDFLSSFFESSDRSLSSHKSLAEDFLSFLTECKLKSNLIVLSYDQAFLLYQFMKNSKTFSFRSMNVYSFQEDPSQSNALDERISQIFDELLLKSDPLCGLTDHK